MTAMFRRVALLVLVVALVAASAARAASCPENCGACVFGRCITCKNGYYVRNNTCTPCEAAHCVFCSAVGMCTECEKGFHITYTNQTANGTDVNLWGICRPINGAAFLTTHNMVAVMLAAVAYLALAA
ncbi:hypothetical protein NESM_000882700 [Novymonas esmeraldas]|uniref:Surface antigen-like protein n=1 Tax=Novymonas esmeraldas TaxID=1808958 RepID=A0AAW0F069_9TRYP